MVNLSLSTVNTLVLIFYRFLRQRDLYLPHDSLKIRTNQFSSSRLDPPISTIPLSVSLVDPVIVAV